MMLSESVFLFNFFNQQDTNTYNNAIYFVSFYLNTNIYRPINLNLFTNSDGGTTYAKKKKFKNYNTANCQKCLKHRSIGINKRPLVEGLSQASLVLYQVPFQNKYYFLKSLIISSFEIIVVSYILTLQFETHKFTCSLDLDQYTCLVFLFFKSYILQSLDSYKFNIVSLIYQTPCISKDNFRRKQKHLTTSFQEIKYTIEIRFFWQPENPTQH